MRFVGWKIADTHGKQILVYYKTMLWQMGSSYASWTQHIQLSNSSKKNFDIGACLGMDLDPCENEMRGEVS